MDGFYVLRTRLPAQPPPPARARRDRLTGTNLKYVERTSRAIQADNWIAAGVQGWNENSVRETRADLDAGRYRPGTSAKAGAAHLPRRDPAALASRSPGPPLRRARPRPPPARTPAAPTALRDCWSTWPNPGPQPGPFTGQRQVPVLNRDDQSKQEAFDSSAPRFPATLE